MSFQLDDGSVIPNNIMFYLKYKIPDLQNNYYYYRSKNIERNLILFKLDEYEDIIWNLFKELTVNKIFWKCNQKNFFNDLESLKIINKYRDILFNGKSDEAMKFFTIYYNRILHVFRGLVMNNIIDKDNLLNDLENIPEIKYSIRQNGYFIYICPSLLENYSVKDDNTAKIN